jgi:NADPH2:quinone reductase
VKAVAVQTFGGPEGLAIIELPVPEPGAGQVLVTTEAIGRRRDPGLARHRAPRRG